MKRRIAREKALQALYQIDMSGQNRLKPWNLCWKKKSLIVFTEVDRRNNRNLDAIDKEISQHLENWSIERLAKVDINIFVSGYMNSSTMRMSRDNVAINEADGNCKAIW